MNTPPEITIDGKKYVMPKPKVKLWRHMIKFSDAQAKGELSGEPMLDEMLNLIAMAFRNPAVTSESVEENMDMEDLPSFFNYIKSRVTGAANAKAAQIPKNVETPAGT